MQDKKQHITFTVYQTETELPLEDKELIDLAKDATETSFSPYSNFCVGAAVLLENGKIIQGSNQENASFTTGTCAERCAMFYANAQYPGVAVSAIAIAAKKRNGAFTNVPISPCGACRQVLAEVEHRQTKPYKVLLYGAKEIYSFDTMACLLPFQFNGDSL